MSQPIPPLLLDAFAHDAAAPYIQNPIPQTTVDPARASFELGFPPQTMTEVFAGGTPPYGQDVNGILNMVTAHLAALNAGQPYLYSSTLATHMGGYAVGSVVAMADGTGLWMNVTAANMTDPDGVGAAGWMPLYNHGIAGPAMPESGVRVLTPAEYRRNIITLGGTLNGNLQVVLPSGTVGQRSWLIVNNLVGAFTTTVKTAAGTGVVIPAGGFSAPVGVYGDGTNIYPSVAPVSLPIDQNPNPLTIAQRTNAGYLFATYFNQNSPLENPSLAAVYVDAGDGYHRKIIPQNFAAQFLLQWFAGQVAPAQVPQASVVQYTPVILSNAALTGSPTAPTAPVGSNSTLVATTQYVMTQSVGNNQNWGNPARAFNTTYTNTTGRPIQVIVCVSLLNSSAAFNVQGVDVAVGSTGGTSETLSASAIVPPGHTYRMNTSGSVTLDSWAELA
jgi:hypothetical protein